MDAGDYIYELWLGNIKVYSGRLNVASGGPIVKNCGIFKVRDIKFYNISNEKRISEYGAKLYAADVRYLASAIYYYDLENKKALTNTKSYIRIYTPKGVLIKCTDVSAVGYTTYATVMDSAIDSECFVLTGVGQERQHLQPGSYRYEVWMDNYKIVDTNVTLF